MDQHNISIESNDRSKDDNSNLLKKDQSPQDDNLLTEISIADLPDLDNSRPPRELPPPKPYNHNPSSTTQTFLLKDRSFTKLDDQPVSSYTLAQKNLTVFKRNLSPNSIKDINSSPKSKKRVSINGTNEATLGNRSLSKKNLLLNEYRTFNPKGRSDKSFNNLTEQTSINNKVKEPNKAEILKKLISGRHGEILSDLKKNALTSLDLSFAGNIKRSQRLTYHSYK